VSRPDLGADDLRQRFQDLPRSTVPGEACPSPEELWESARGELPPERNRAVIDHTGRCPSCAEAWRLARFVSRRAREEGGLAAGPRGATPPRWWWSAAAAAVLVVALGSAGLLLRHARERAPVYRNETKEAIEPLTPEDQPLSRADPTLRWSGPDGATYDVRVTTEGVRVLARAEDLEEPRYTLPASVVAGLDPGTPLLWRVEATLPGGGHVASRAFRVSIE